MLRLCLKILPHLLFLILSVLCLSPETIAAPAKTLSLDTGSKKSSQPDPTVNPAKSEDVSQSAPQPSGVGTAKPSDPKKITPEKNSDISAAGLDKKSEKILATINGTNITQGDYELSLMQRRLTPASSNVTAQVIDEVFDELINEILVRNYLEKNGRLNDPLLEKRIKVLRTQAINEYFQYMVATSLKPLTEAELQTFITEHPDYFKDRRYYYFTSIDIVKTADVDVSQLRSMLNSSDNFNKIIQTMDSKKISYTVFRGFRPSEQINETVFAKLKTLSPGETALVMEPEGNQIFILKLFSSSADPIDAEKKREEIRVALIMGKVTQQATDLVKQLRNSAEIKIIDKPKALAAAAPGKFSMTNARVQTASESVLKKFDWRGKKRADSGDFAQDISSAENQNKNKIGNQLVVAFVSNIWILSLFLIVPAIFYNFVNNSKKMYAKLVLDNTQGINRGFSSSSSFQKVLLDPIVTWIIGFLLTLLIGNIAWDAFHEKNLDLLYLSKKSIVISVISSLLFSTVLIFVASRVYQRLPDYIINFRLLFFGIIIIANVGILKIL